MDRILNLKIDVTKIDKEKLFKGEKGTYLDCTIFLKDQKDGYGNNGMITQSTTKEERESGNKGAILGNCKLMGDAKKSEPKESKPKDPEDDTLPF